jgi:hypothetical protein
MAEERRSPCEGCKDKAFRCSSDCKPYNQHVSEIDSAYELSLGRSRSGLCLDNRRIIATA